MPDITTISTALRSIKTAADIAKLIKDSGVTLEAAEVKLKMADLMSALADVKADVADLKLEMISKDEKITELEKQLKQTKSITFDGFVYWLDNDPIPICPHCYEVDKIITHMRYGNLSINNENMGWSCKNCKGMYADRTRDLTLQNPHVKQ